MVSIIAAQHFTEAIHFAHEQTQCSIAISSKLNHFRLEERKDSQTSETEGSLQGWEAPETYEIYRALSVIM